MRPASPCMSPCCRPSAFKFGPGRFCFAEPKQPAQKTQQAARLKQRANPSTPPEAAHGKKWN